MPTDKTTIQCPLCGNAVALGVSKCPVCATDLEKTIARRRAETKESTPKTDYLHKELPKLELPKATVTCPQCALQLQGGEDRCPRCGIPLAGEKEMLECPQCGGLAPYGSRSCPNCGIGFEEAPEAPAPLPAIVEELPPPPEPIEPVSPIEPAPEVVTEVPAAAKATSYGLTNGRGAVNGTGLTNGRGAVSGTGLVNGTGMTNGTRADGRIGQPSVARSGIVLRRWQFLVVLIALAVVVPTFVYLSYSNGTETMIDGDFGEWNAVDTFGVAVVASSPNVAIEEWAVKTDGTRLYMYVMVQGEVMGSTEVDSFFLFVDSDNNPDTGYSVSGIGADYLMEMDGWDDAVQSTALKEYGPDQDHFDWNSWVRTDSLAIAIHGNKMEAMAMIPMAMSADAKYLLQSQDNLATQTYSISHPVPETGGVLVIEQEYGSGVIEADSTIAPGTSIAIMHLVLSCEGSSGHVDSITPIITGADPVGSIVDIDLEYGEEFEIDVVVDSSQASAGQLVEVQITEASVSSTFQDVRIVGAGVRAYVSSAPSAIQIDGAFGDWEGLTTADFDSVSNPNVDISAVGAVNTTSSSYFFVSVLGEVCSGSYVPVTIGKPTGGGGGIVIPTKKTGEDITSIYVDSDMDALTGGQISIVSKSIGADYKIEIKGLDGIIQSKALYHYSSGTWVMDSATVDAENDYRRIEIGVSASALGGASDIEFIVETTDWRQNTDFATAVPSGSREITVTPDPGFDRWIVDGSSTSPSATAQSYQRKLFFDGVNYWSFFYDGSNTVYKYSSDDGKTWTLVGNAFSSTGITAASVWYYQAGNLVYIIGDSTVASTTAHVRMGTVTPATHTITWSGDDSTPTVSTLSIASKNTYISRDSSGYLWAVSTNHTQTTPNRYQLSVFKSTSTDSVTSWTHSGNLLGAAVAQSNSKGSVVNIGSGSTMLAVYGSAGSVYSRTYETGWSTETTIYGIGTGNPENTDNAPPVVVVDGNGIAHVVYGNGHQQPAISKPYIYYVRFDGSAWSVPYRLESVGNNVGNVYPTISADTSTGNLYAFWIQTDAFGVGITIAGRKNVGGTWSDLTFTPQTTAPKSYLNSVYSAPSETYIAFQWTQNTTTPIEVVFDKIPEFSTVVLPVFAMMLLMFVAIRRGRKKEASG